MLIARHSIRSWEKKLCAQKSFDTDRNWTEIKEKRKKDMNLYKKIYKKYSCVE